MSSDSKNPFDSPSLRLKGKVALVTGGAGGIGGSICLRFAEEGARVVVVDLDILAASDLTKTIGEMGYESLALKTDVSNDADVQNMVKKVIDTFGTVDILVNNAAIYSTLSLLPCEEIEEDEWDKVFKVNVKGVWLCSKAVIPIMKAKRYGKIINIASGAVWSAPEHMAHYVASKSAIIGLTRVMARELGDFNIQVNAVAPGLIMTNASKNLHPESFIKRSYGRKSIKRIAHPMDVVGLVLFLASDDSNYITGQTVVVDGGGVLR
jgi:3-oxoacyl-[acyl-carrier protein] reductase